MCDQLFTETQAARMRELAAELGAEAVQWAEEKIEQRPSCNEARGYIGKLAGKVAVKRGLAKG